MPGVGTLLPQIHITRGRLKQLEAIALIREQRDNGKQELAYNARPFVLCGIPIRRSLQQELAYLRRNGKFFLEITSHPLFGLPYGQNRLIPIWVAPSLSNRNLATFISNLPPRCSISFTCPMMDTIIGVWLKPSSTSLAGCTARGQTLLFRPKAGLRGGQFVVQSDSRER